MAPVSDMILRRLGRHSMVAWGVVPFVDCMSVDVEAVVVAVAVVVVVAVAVGDAVGVVVVVVASCHRTPGWA